MTAEERKITEKQIETMLERLDSIIADSVVNHFGSPHSNSNKVLEEMMDDLISKLNDRD